MRIALLLPLAASIAVACSSADDTRTIDSTTLGPPLSPSLAGACSSMSRLSRSSLRVVVGRARTTRFPAPPQTPGTWHGCHLVANAPARADSAARPADVLIQEALRAEGWTPDARFAASGPASSQVGMRRAGALCVIGVTHPGAAPSAAPPAPSAPYRLDIRCTEAAAVGG